MTLDEIRVEVEKLHGLVTFLLVPEAEEYRKTISALSAPSLEPPAGDAPANAEAPATEEPAAELA